MSLGETLLYSGKTGLLMDYSGMDLNEDYLKDTKGLITKALKDMDELDKGAISNPSEGRMVGHYWLRNPELAPNEEIKNEITTCFDDVEQFVSDIHNGVIRTEKGDTFSRVISAGIGGSSLGPVFVSNALKGPDNKMSILYMDNTDPAAMDKVFEEIKDDLDRTLVVIISKSGGTIETRNCMVETKAFYEANGLCFEKHAVCITGVGSKLYNTAKDGGWLKIFPMWDFVGGRTSLMSAVGLVPMALQGIDINALLKGAKDIDEEDRNPDPMKNPAAVLALSWYRETKGKGGITQVVIPYKTSLELLSKYLQQLLMESLGKELDLDGNTVNQGLAVFGNKGTSDQHSYVQQLVGGPSNVFITFIQILKDRKGRSPQVEEGSTSGDFLNAFMQGTKKALESHGKHTLVITLPEADEYNIGQVIALFERAVGIYASMIHINAYDQPAVEFGKKAAGEIISSKIKAYNLLKETGKAMTSEEIGDAVGSDPADIFRIMLHLAANEEDVMMDQAEDIFKSTFRVM